MVVGWELFLLHQKGDTKEDRATRRRSHHTTVQQSKASLRFWEVRRRKGTHSKQSRVVDPPHYYPPYIHTYIVSHSIHITSARFTG